METDDVNAETERLESKDAPSTNEEPKTESKADLDHVLLKRRLIIPLDRKCTVNETVNDSKILFTAINIF